MNNNYLEPDYQSLAASAVMTSVLILRIAYPILST